MKRSQKWMALHNESGFTLIELLAVAVIMIILALIALPVYAGAADTSRKARSLEELRRLSLAVDNYYTDNGKYPAQLQALVTAGYLKPTSFVTAWPEYNYFFAYTTVGSDSHTEYIIGVPTSAKACAGNACSPNQNAPTVPVSSESDLAYYIQSR